MKTSCVKHPFEHPFIKIYQWQIDATGSREGAALMSIFENWHNHLIEVNKMQRERSKVEDKKDITDLLQFHTYDTLIKQSLGIIKSRPILSNCIKKLVELKFISKHSNPNPKYKFDQTTYYLFHPKHVNQYILSIVQNRTMESNDMNYGEFKDELSIDKNRTDKRIDILIDKEIDNNNIKKDSFGRVYLNGVKPSPTEIAEERKNLKEKIKEQEFDLEKEVNKTAWVYCVSRGWVKSKDHLTALCNQRIDFIKDWCELFIVNNENTFNHLVSDLESAVKRHIIYQHKQDCGKARWCKEYKDSKDDVNENGYKDYYCEWSMKNLKGEKLTGYFKHLQSLGFKKVNNPNGTIWKDKHGQRVN